MSTKNNYRSLFYDQYHTHQVSQRHENIRARLEEDRRTFTHQLLPYLPSDRSVRILDVGCGFGSLVYTLQKEGYAKVEGIDVSSEQVETAHKLNIEGVKRADLFEYLDQDQRWDVILAVDLIEHFDKPQAVELLKIMHKSLSDGGRLLVRTPNIDAPFGSAYAYGDFTHGYVLNGSSARQLFRSVGFEQVKVLPAKTVEKEGVQRFFQSAANTLMRGVVKTIFYATGRSMRNIILTPNMIVTAEK